MIFEIASPVAPRLLADQISTALGRELAVSCRQPGQTDQDGNPLPGLVVVVEAGEPIPEDDETRAVIDAVIAAHVIPEPPVPVMVQLAEAVSSASDFAGLQAAVIAFAEANTPPARVQSARSSRRIRN